MNNQANKSPWVRLDENDESTWPENEQMVLATFVEGPTKKKEPRMRIAFVHAWIVEEGGLIFKKRKSLYWRGYGARTLGRIRYWRAIADDEYPWELFMEDYG